MDFSVNGILLSQVLWYMIHIEMNIFEQGIPSWMIPDQYNIITHTETYKVIFLKIEEIPRLW